MNSLQESEAVSAWVAQAVCALNNAKVVNKS